MSRLSDFATWSVEEKRKLISQLIIDAVTTDNICLLSALLGPHISRKEEEEFDRYTRELVENRKRVYPEEIRISLFQQQLQAIKDYELSSVRHQDLTCQGYCSAVEVAYNSWRENRIEVYKEDLERKYQMSTEEGNSSAEFIQTELQQHIARINTISEENLFLLENLDQLPAVINLLNEKLASSLAAHEPLRVQAEHLGNEVETLSTEMMKKRALHCAAVDKAYAPQERIKWGFHSKSLADMSYAEFKELTSYNADQERSREQRVTVDNCVTSDGSALLHLAFYNRAEEMARILISEYGADPAKKNLRGETAQQFAKIESRDDPFLLVVLDKKRVPSPYLQAVQQHLENYKHDILDANVIMRIIHHCFWNVAKKHNDRVTAYTTLQEAIGQAVQLHHDDYVARLVLQLKGRSDRPEGIFFEGLMWFLERREAGLLESPRRSLHRIDSATSAQDVELLDSFNREVRRANAMAEQRDVAVQELVAKTAEFKSTIEGKQQSIEALRDNLREERVLSAQKDDQLAKRDVRLVEKDEVIAVCQQQLSEKDDVIAVCQRQLLEKNEMIAERDKAITALTEGQNDIITKNGVLAKTVKEQGEELQSLGGKVLAQKETNQTLIQTLQAQEQKLKAQGDEFALLREQFAKFTEKQAESEDEEPKFGK